MAFFSLSVLLFYKYAIKNLTIGSWLACVYRVLDARGRLLSTKKAYLSHEAIASATLLRFLSV